MKIYETKILPGYMGSVEKTRWLRTCQSAHMAAEEFMQEVYNDTTWFLIHW